MHGLPPHVDRDVVVRLTESELEHLRGLARSRERASPTKQRVGVTSDPDGPLLRHLVGKVGDFAFAKAYGFGEPVGGLFFTEAGKVAVKSISIRKTFEMNWSAPVLRVRVDELSRSRCDVYVLAWWLKWLPGRDTVRLVGWLPKDEVTKRGELYTNDYDTRMWVVAWSALNKIGPDLRGQHGLAGRAHGRG